MLVNESFFIQLCCYSSLIIFLIEVPTAAIPFHFYIRIVPHNTSCPIFLFTLSSSVVDPEAMNIDQALCVYGTYSKGQCTVHTRAL